MNGAAIVALVVTALAVSACTGAGQPSPGGASPEAGTVPAQSADSGGGGQSGGGTKPDPCTLLTPTDLKAKLGAEFQPGNLVGTTAAPTVECEWAKQGGFTAWLTLAIDDIGSSGWGCLGTAESVPGVGDEACLGDVGLHVKQGSWDLVFAGCGLCITNDQLIDVAKVAVSHL
jgi:hypothetical protein